MTLFDLQPSREVGLLKDAVKEAILEGEIPNEHQSALRFVIRKAAAMGLHPKSSQA
jgi:tRNA nucleotidyltransferase (CCA-adding enzyme)